MFSIFKKLFTVTEQEEFRERLVDSGHGILFEDEMVPRYPPFYAGLPMVAPTQLVETQAEMVAKIRQVIGLAPKDFDSLVVPLITNFAAMVHLLPASETHHHKGSGGLLRHSLEVGCFSAQLAQGLVFGFGKTPAERKNEEPRWIVAAFTAGLLHDIGKVASDVSVVSDEGSKKWSPYYETLWDWGQLNKVRRYYIHWNDNRHQAHLNTGMLLVNKVMPPELLGWLGDCPDIIARMMEATICKGNHQLSSCVKEADSASTSKDIKQNYDIANQVSVGVPVERHVLDAMRRLLHSGEWQVNDKSRIWILDGSVFIVWANAVQEVLQMLQENDVRGIPRDPDSIADLLLDRELATYNTSEEGRSYRYWEIAPFSLERPSGLHYLQCLRLSKPELLFSSVVPLSTDGIIHVADTQYIRDNPNRKPAVKVGADDGAGEAKKEVRQPRNMPTMPTKEKNSIEAPAAVLPVPNAEPPKETGKTRNDEEQLDIPLTEVPAQSELAEVSGDLESGADSSMAKPAKAPVEKEQTKEGDESAERARKWLASLPGDTGQLLHEIIESLKDGGNSRETLFGRNSDGLYLKYPDPIRVFGPPARCLNLLSESNLIVSDPLNESRRARDTETGKGLFFPPVAAAHLEALIAQRESAMQLSSKQDAKRDTGDEAPADKISPTKGKKSSQTRVPSNESQPGPKPKPKRQQDPESSIAGAPPTPEPTGDESPVRPPKRSIPIDDEAQAIAADMVDRVRSGDPKVPAGGDPDKNFHTLSRLVIRRIYRTQYPGSKAPVNAIYAAIQDNPYVETTERDDQYFLFRIAKK